MRQTRDEAAANGIADLREHDWDRLSCLFQRRQRPCGACDDVVRFRSDQLGRVGAQARGIAAAPANVEPYIPAIVPSKLLKSLSQRRNEALSFRIALAKHHKHADPSHLAGLLRARRERTGEGCAAKKGEKIAPSHVLPGAKHHAALGTIAHFAAGGGDQTRNAATRVERGPVPWNRCNIRSSPRK